MNKVLGIAAAIASFVNAGIALHQGHLGFALGLIGGGMAFVSLAFNN